MTRRRAGALLPLELRILESGLQLQSAGESFHGFQLAAHLSADSSGSTALTAHGTLYKALGRMQEAGLLESQWEDPQIAAEASRPRRRLYAVTPDGTVALATARAASPAPASRVASRHSAPSAGGVA